MSKPETIICSGYFRSILLFDRMNLTPSRCNKGLPNALACIGGGDLTRVNAGTMATLTVRPTSGRAWKLRVFQPFPALSQHL